MSIEPAAGQQAGLDRAGRLEELRRQYQELTEEIIRGETAAGERQRTEQESAATQAAEARRRRTAADAEELRKALDDRFRINSEYKDRVRRLREAEAAGGITGADRTRLETLALRERDEALRCAALRAPPAAWPASRVPTARPSAKSTTSSASASG